MMLLSCCLSLLAGAQADGEPSDEGAESLSPREARAELQERVFARDPRDLPRGEPGRFADWTLSTPVPDELLPLVQRAAQAYYVEQDYGGTLAALYDLLEIEPDYPPALFQLGTVYFRLRRYGDTIVALERFCEVAPKELAKTQALAHAHYSLGDYERALEHYETILAAGNDSSEARRGYGLAKMRLGDTEGALEELRAVVEAEPEHGDAWAWIARILYDLERSDDALEPARKGVRFEPYEPRPWFVLAEVLFDLGRDDEAVEVQERFDELTRLVQSIRAAEGLLARDPRQPHVLVELVDLHAEVGDVQAVRETIARLYTLEPDNCELRAWSIQRMVDLGDDDGALAAAQAYEESCPDDKETWRRLEIFYASRGDIENQIRCGERYLRMGGKRD